MQYINLLFFLSITLKSVASFELKQIAIVTKPPNLNDTAFHGENLRASAKKIWNGNIMLQLLFGGMGSSGTFVIHPSGITTEIIPSQITREENSKIIGTIVENNVLKVINEKTTISITSVDTGDLQLQTFSTNGFQSAKNQSISTTIQRFKQSADKIELIDSKYEYSSRFVVSKHKPNGGVISEQVFDGKYASSIIPDFPDDDKGYSVQLKNGLIYIFKLIDSNNHGNFNGSLIKITGFNPHSFIGKIESPNATSVRVQSSENIIDWMDIDKIANPDGKEIVIPFSKGREFIRIVE
jgi:hypothetical protein